MEQKEEKPSEYSIHTIYILSSSQWILSSVDCIHKLSFNSLQNRKKKKKRDFDVNDIWLVNSFSWPLTNHITEPTLHSIRANRVYHIFGDNSHKACSWRWSNLPKFSQTLSRRFILNQKSEAYSSFVVLFLQLKNTPRWNP